MQQLAFFADENIPAELINWLNARNYRVSGIVNERLFGIDDIDIIEKAWVEKLIILTQDADFGKIIYTQEVQFLAIIYLRPGHFDALFHVLTLEAIFKNIVDIPERTIIIGQRKENKIKIRIRHL